MYAHKRGTKKLKRHGLHGFALDQPSINGIGPINRSEKMKRSETVGHSRKRSETWSGQNLFNPHLFLNKHFRAAPFFFEGPKVSKGKRLETVGDGTFARQKSTCFYTIFKHFSWTYAKKQVLFCRAKVPSPTVSNRFPLDTFGPSKKTALRGNAYLKTNVGWTSFGLIMFPTVSDCFRPFPTVSFFLND